MYIILCGCFGSIAVAIVSLSRSYDETSGVPQQYRRYQFWLIRMGLALVGGFLAVMQEAPTAMIAFQIGLTAPAIIEAFTQEPVKKTPSKRQLPGPKSSSSKLVD
jgi:hypothetical protein